MLTRQFDHRLMVKQFRGEVDLCTPWGTWMRWRVYSTGQPPWLLFRQLLDGCETGLELVKRRSDFKREVARRIP